jgi:hypothetical protein
MTSFESWIPAFAGMTRKKDTYSSSNAIALGRASSLPSLRLSVSNVTKHPLPDIVA